MVDFQGFNAETRRAFLAIQTEHGIPFTFLRSWMDRLLGSGFKYPEMTACKVLIEGARLSAAQGISFDAAMWRVSPPKDTGEAEDGAQSDFLGDIEVQQDRSRLL